VVGWHGHLPARQASRGVSVPLAAHCRRGDASLGRAALRSVRGSWFFPRLPPRCR